MGRPFRSVRTVLNAGPDAATGARLAFEIPASAALASAVSSVGSCAGTPLVCAFGTLAPGATATVELVVTPSALGALALTAHATTTVADAFFADSGARLAATVATSVDAELEGDVPAHVTLGPSAPNPFAAASPVRFGLPAAGRVRLSLYDVLGREVAVLVDGDVAAGWHAARVDGAGLAAGLYVLRLETGGTSRTRTAVRVR